MEAHQLSDQQFADLITQQILPKWRAERDTFAKLQNLPASEARLTVRLVKYMNTREEAWTQLAEGLREGDQGKQTQSFAKNQEADQLAASMGSNK